ncbi:MAG: glycoside hydrolase family 2 TIM barrel-domain containing protein [Pirellulaceae bacterium]
MHVLKSLPSARALVTLLVCHICLITVSRSSAAGDFVWIEGEQPTSVNVETNRVGWGNQQFLSDGHWLSLSFDNQQVEKDVPAEGVLIKYAFGIKQDNEFEIWQRIGFEFVRSPFDWRIDAGAWTRVEPEQLTTDLMEIALWCEVAWLQLAKQSLTAGPHVLEIRLPKIKTDKGENHRILYTCDAICIHGGTFHPHSKFKPDEPGRDERDAAAAANVFQLPESATTERVSVPLSGLWEVCRHDEQLPGDVAVPLRDFPEHPHWKAINVPGDKNTLRPDLLFAHRLWYRTRFKVPAYLDNRSWLLVFPANNLNTTLFVNGQFCGFDKNPFVRLQFDVSAAIKPGVNEVWVGIRDGWYGYQADPQDPMKLRRRWNLPLKYFSEGFQELVYPIWNQNQMGIVGTPQLIAAGPVYVADVFCKPSVAHKQMGVEVTLQSNQASVEQVDLTIEAVNDQTGNVEQTWERPGIDLHNGAAVLMTQLEWSNPRLWWPDDPSCYRLRTTVRAGGALLDSQETLFGFREWTCEGVHLQLNGITWQGFTEHGVPGETPEAYLAALKDPRFNYGFGRMWPQHGGHYKWLGQEPEQVLTCMDRGGALIRRTGYLDGEAAGYMPAVLPELGRNWIDHLQAWIKGERNHPSIMIWSVENELNFINARNLGQLDAWEPVLADAWKAIQQVDPTRPIMVDGGGATRAQTLPVHGDHYTTKPFWNYPQLAYEANADQPPWTWDQQRPKFIGEELFAAGINPAYAYFGGEQVFLGKSGNRPAVGKAMQVISQGYRWFGIAACDFCQQPSDADGSQYNGWAPRAVLVRQWDYAFASGRTAKRMVGVFNNTRFADPLSFQWSLMLDGQHVANQTTVHDVAAGESEKFDVELPIPHTDRRLEGEWILTLSADGQELFRDVKAVSVLPSGPDRRTPPHIAQLRAGDLWVFDPHGEVTALLAARSIPFTPLDHQSAPTAAGKIWLIGRDALSPADTSSTLFAAYASAGGRVILLEQEHALRYQGLQPAEVEYQANVGRTAFLEDASHPLLRGLQDKDFFTWEPGEIVYKNAYLKPQRGARSIVQCDESLVSSALVTIPVNQGLVTLCQLTVGEKLADNPTAETLVLNLLDYSASYELKFLETAAAAEPAFAKVLDSINLQYGPAANPLAAIAEGRIAIVSATSENLRELGTASDRLASFHASGGWLVLHGLAPEGLQDFNQLVGIEHMIRPFGRERVTFALPRSRLLAGVSLSDVALYSAERIFPWQSGNFVASDTFSHVVDLDEVASFGNWNSEAWYNFINGMVSADGWKYIQNHPATENTYRFSLPKPQTLVGWTWDGNVMYNPTRKVELIFDGDEAHRLTFNVPPDGEPMRFEIQPPRAATEIAIRHAQYDDTPDKRQNGVPLIGCDNIEFFAQRPADYRARVRPMLNCGGLVEYPRGEGGIVLVNLLFPDMEDVPANGLKKRNVLAAILRNLGAPFGGGRAVIAGAQLACTPIDISKHATAYRTQRGWFGDARFTLTDLPAGRQQLAGVTFEIYDFPTSPVPTCIMLAGPNLSAVLPTEVRAIPVHRRADALFFLHTARIDQRRNDQEKKEGQQFELVHYVVHYADGQELTIPIVSELDIDDYRVSEPRALPHAQLAWTRPYEGTTYHAAVYSRQWNNPRPNIEIQSIDVLPVEDPRGSVALLAITAACAE